MKIAKLRVLALAFIAACGNSSGGAPDAPNLADAAPDAPDHRIAEVAVLEGNLEGTNSTYAIAGFGADNMSTIASRDDGPCHIEQQIQGAFSTVDGGTVTITGSSGGTMTLVPDSTNHYLAMTAGLKYAADEMLTISTTGATGPAFSGTVTFPARVTVTSPTSVTTLHKSGFSASWNPTTGPVIFRVAQYRSGGPDTHIDCVFDGATGTGAIPGSALTDLMTSTLGSSIVIITETKTTSSAGAYAVTLDCVFQAIGGNVAVQP